MCKLRITLYSFIAATATVAVAAFLSSGDNSTQRLSSSASLRYTVSKSAVSSVGPSVESSKDGVPRGTRKMTSLPEKSRIQEVILKEGSDGDAEIAFIQSAKDRGIDAIPELTDLLENTDVGETRALAYRAMGVIGRDIASSDDPESRVARNAINAVVLAEFQKPVVSEDASSSKLMALDTLITIHDDDSFSQLKQLAQNQELDDALSAMISWEIENWNNQQLNPSPDRNSTDKNLNL